MRCFVFPGRCVLAGVGRYRYHTGMTEDHIFRAIQLSLLEKDKKEQAAFHTTIERVLSFVAAVADVDLPKQQSSPAGECVS